MTASMTTSFLSCDWGTSMLRLRLVDMVSLEVLEEYSSTQGIGITYELWSNLGGKTDRLAFYSGILGEALGKLEERHGGRLAGIPIICSGMASSSIGIRELPYAGLPFALDGSDTLVWQMEESGCLPNPLCLISGVKGENEVMRGEETELLGAVNLASGLPPDCVAILPGTHSKHIVIKDGFAVDFCTYMTGELFALLKSHSTLQHSLQEPIQTDWDLFRKGLLLSRESSLLGNLFQIRTNELLQHVAKTGNHDFLSGLLIGSELHDALEGNERQIILLGNSDLSRLYAESLQFLDANFQWTELSESIRQKAVLSGQLLIFQQNIISK